MRIVSSDHAGEWPIAKSRPVARVPTWEVHRYLYGVTTKLKPEFRVLVTLNNTHKPSTVRVERQRRL